MRMRHTSAGPDRALSLLLGFGLGALMGCDSSDAPRSDTRPAPPPPLAPSVQLLARQRGQAIAQETFAILSSNLLQALQSGGVSNALPFCSLAASPLTAGVAARQGVGLRRVTHKPRNPAARANAEELRVLEVFQSAKATSTNPPPPLVTNLVPGQATFFAPILLAKDLCLKCHGEPGKDIAASDLEIIRRLYPADEATGFRLGDLRGAWRIDVPIAGSP